jgi:cobalamin biosynthesis Co2+ chelatase CbiK
MTEDEKFVEQQKKYLVDFPWMETTDLMVNKGDFKKLLAIIERQKLEIQKQNTIIDMCKAWSKHYEVAYRLNSEIKFAELQKILGRE